MGLRTNFWLTSFFVAAAPLLMSRKQKKRFKRIQEMEPKVKIGDYEAKMKAKRERASQLKAALDTMEVSFARLPELTPRVPRTGSPHYSTQHVRGGGGAGAHRGRGGKHQTTTPRAVTGGASGGGGSGRGRGKHGKSGSSARKDVRCLCLLLLLLLLLLLPPSFLSFSSALASSHSPPAAASFVFLILFDCRC
jgi:hypothetical protein